MYIFSFYICISMYSISFFILLFEQNSFVLVLLVRLNSPQAKFFQQQKLGVSQKFKCSLILVKKFLLNNIIYIFSL